jgi:secreted PhoX family phosphatase
MKTAADPDGRTVHGTFNNCACGRTPWGTYLSCEENFGAYFVRNLTDLSLIHDRYGIGQDNASWGYRWQEFDERFDAAKHPNEPNRFGWVVELDPFDPTAMPKKRTALGRVAHEGATVLMAPDKRVVVYMGDDDFRSKYEHIYKFVSMNPWVDGGGAKENDAILDEGTLYAARFDADGTGRWLELAPGANGLTPEAGFPTLAEILINTRTAASAQNMARAQWDPIGNNQLLIADPTTRRVRRFLTGPVGCEITGFQITPDQRTLFVNIQHPGEAPRRIRRATTPTNPGLTARGPTETQDSARAPPPSPSSARTAASSERDPRRRPVS